MSHRVQDVVDAEAVGEAGHDFGILGHVGVFPGVADVLIEIDGDDEAAVGVVESAPVGRGILGLDDGRAAGSAPEVTQAGDHDAFANGVEQVHDGIVVSDFGDHLIGIDATHGGGEEVPIGGTMKIVDDEEAAAVEVFAEAFGLVGAEIPVAGLGRVGPGVVEDAIVGEGKVEGVAGLNAGEAADALGEVDIGFGPILLPPAAAAIVEPAAGLGMINVFDAEELVLSALGEGFTPFDGEEQGGGGEGKGESPA